MRAKYDYDNLWSLFYVGKEAEMLGCKKMIFAEDGPPNVGDMVIRTPADIAKLKVPDSIEDHPAFAEPLKCLSILRAEAAGRYPICAYLTSCMTLPAILMGMDKWMEMVLLGPADLRDAVLTKCSDFFRMQVDAYRRAGADILVYANPYGSTGILPMKLIRQLSLPWMRRDLAGFDMNGFVYYCGGASLTNVLDMAASELGFKAFYLSTMDDIPEGKRIVAGRGLVGSVINDAKLIDWSEKEIRAEVRRICEAGKPGGQFFFGTLLMPYRIPERNIRALFEAAYEFGAMGAG
jgi:uroporphyrinogen-III decarboxylase